MVTRLSLVAVSGLILAGCGEQPPEMSSEMKRALSAPENAVECRMVYRKTEADERKATNSYVPTSGAELLGAAIGRGIANGINESRRKRKLAECYNLVNAPMEERLPMDGPNGASATVDAAAFEGSSPAPVQTVPSNPSRQGSGGGAGFSTF